MGMLTPTHRQSIKTARRSLRTKHFIPDGLRVAVTSNWTARLWRGRSPEDFTHDMEVYANYLEDTLLRHLEDQQSDSDSESAPVTVALIYNRKDQFAQAVATLMASNDQTGTVKAHALPSQRWVRRLAQAYGVMFVSHAGKDTPQSLGFSW